MQATFSPVETRLATLAGLTAFFTALFTASMINVAVPPVMGSFGVVQSQAQLLLSTFLAMNSTGLAMAMFAMGITAALGELPAVGGLIIEAFQWRLMFLAPIPLTLLAIVLGFFFLPALPRPLAFD